jgi:phage protein D
VETVTPVQQPAVILTYETKDITAYIAPFLLSVTYTDRLEGESDEIEINLEDRDHRWQNAWFPSKGDKLNLKLGYYGNRLMPCGDFQIDEIELSGPPDTVTIRALAAGIKESLRTKKSRAYEGKSLKQIAGTVAAAHGFKVTGKIPDVKIGRVTQNQERDLAFLQRLAEAYGCVFSVRGNLLVFHELADLQSRKSVLTIDRKDMKTYFLQDKTSRVYKAARVSYWDSKTKKLITTTVDNKAVKGGDSLIITERFENKQQAILRANAALKKSNIRQVEGNVVVIGNPLLVAGNNVKLTGLGKLSNTYLLRVSRHTVDRSNGYSTDIEVISHA